MKKLLALVVAIGMLAFAGNVAAYDGDFEISGHINTGLGWQYNGKAVESGLGGIFYEEGMIPIDVQWSAANTKLVNNSTWLFYVGDVELDITKTFGENIRLRTDLDFLRANSNGFLANAFAAGQLIEQAYVTINIPVGYGLEFLVGRFNAPMGFEAVDNNDNDLPFHSLIFNFLRPQNLTGIKFYYPFSDLFDLHIWVANNLRDVVAGGSSLDGDLPAGGARLGFTWGMEGQESTLGLSGAFSEEARNNVGRSDKWGELTYIGDLDFNVWINDVFALGGEGILRRDGAIRGQKDNYYFGGLLNLHYIFSDVWDGTLRYTYANDKAGGTLAVYSGQATLNYLPPASQIHRYGGAGLNVAGDSALGYDAQFHQVDLGINYHITDGAKMMAMYRFEMIMPDKRGLAASYANFNKMGMTHSIAANFAYDF